MSNTPYKQKWPTGQTAPNNIAKNGLPTYPTLPSPQISRSKHLPMAVSRPNHVPTRPNHPPAAVSLPNRPSTTVSRPSHLSSLSYSRYSKTHSNTSSKLPKIHKNGQSNTGVTAHLSIPEVSLSSDCVSLQNKINCSFLRDSLSPWDTLGQCNVENGGELFSLREFLEQCSPTLEEDLCNNKSLWFTIKRTCERIKVFP